MGTPSVLTVAKYQVYPLKPPKGLAPPSGIESSYCWQRQLPEARGNSRLRELSASEEEASCV